MRSHKNNYVKAIFISFNQAYYEAIVSIMDRNNLKRFYLLGCRAGQGEVKQASHITAITLGLP